MTNFEKELREQYAVFAEAEPAVSAEIATIAKNFGLEMAGWEFRLKTWKSAFEKVAVRHEEEDIKSMKDVLRYTFLIDEDNFGSCVNRLIKSMESRGIAINKLKNYWITSSAYNGVNAQTSFMGFAVEVQFHTVDSLRVKEEEQHPLYEKKRMPNLKPAVKQAIENEAYRIAATQRRPKGFAEISHINWDPDF